MVRWKTMKKIFFSLSEHFEIIRKRVSGAAPYPRWFLSSTRCLETVVRDDRSTVVLRCHIGVGGFREWKKRLFFHYFSLGGGGPNEEIVEHQTNPLGNHDRGINIRIWTQIGGGSARLKLSSRSLFDHTRRGEKEWKKSLFFQALVNLKWSDHIRARATSRGHTNSIAYQFWRATEQFGEFRPHATARNRSSIKS